MPHRILLTGATGYIGGQLLPQLEAAGHQIRCLARRPEFLAAAIGPGTEIVAGDLLQPETLAPALAGIDTAFYLVHSMQGAGDFAARDRQAARNFAAAADAAGVRRIIYLGGLGESRGTLSPHLASRQEVGEALRESRAQVLEFRASIVIGSGSISYELIRTLVQRLPIMITPRWVRVPAQPIFIDDLLAYLAAAVTLAVDGDQVLEIGGRDVVSYGDLMLTFARQHGLKRWLLPVPVLTPWLSSLWLGIVTPVYARIGRCMMSSIRHPTVVTNPRARELFAFEPIGVEEAIARVHEQEQRDACRSHWTNAVSSGSDHRQWAGVTFGSRLIDLRERVVSCPPHLAFAPIQRLGGHTGWYYANWLWRLRGVLDRLVGGVGLRRGRRHPVDLRAGDALDFWRVSEFIPDRRLRLEAEMKLPGRAWLEFTVQPEGDGSRLRQLAIFDPIGLWGRLYWYAMMPLHGLVFAGMLRKLARAAEREQPS